jgi:hypothetical protein
MRRTALFVLPLLGVLSSSPSAFAQSTATATAPGGKSRSPNSQFLLRRGETGGPAGVAARGKARGGDCAGALNLFDDALRTTVEPTLFRDRGLCHEKLEHVHPAMDDYRAYLVARPDAPDADQIRERLARLEGMEGGHENDAASPDRPPEKEDGASATASMSLNGEGASASASTKRGGKGHKGRSDVIGPKSGDQDARGFDAYAADERTADEAESSALREGTGFIAGAFIHVPRYFFGSGGTSDMAYAVGGTFRYATSASFTLVSEIGYAGIGTKGQIGALGGPLLFLGGELRVPISSHAGDQIVLGAGPGAEFYTVSNTKASLNFWSLRLRGGYRHVFGPRVALEVLADGGPVLLTSDVEGSTSTFGGVLGGSVAFVAAF